MTPFSIELTGMFPRSEALVRATRDFDRKRINKFQMAEVLHTQQASILQMQKKLSVSLFSDGMLNWQDIFRPFATFCRGIEPVTLTRFADTNTFFRQPRITGNLRYTGSHVTEYFSCIESGKNWKATLPAPFFFARVSDDRHYNSVKKLTFAFTEALAHLIIALSKYSYCSFQLFDPYLGYLGATNSELHLIVDAIEQLINKTKAAISYHVGFSCPRKVAVALAQTKLDAIGIDFLHTDINTIPLFQGKKGLIAGCLDSRTSLAEDPEALAKFLFAVVKKVKPRELRATSNIDLQFVPVVIAQKKLFNLQRAIKIISKNI